MIGRILWPGLLLAGLTLCAAAADERKWKDLAVDGLHDPASLALPSLQNPRAALKVLPADGAGNQVNWVKALREGQIKPRTNLLEITKGKVLDLDVIMTRTDEMPYVRFPHLAHTEWLDCSNCHEGLFKSKAGATPVNMLAILQGEYCGRCHGAVSFPLTECNRCHSVLKSSVAKKPPAKK